MISGHTKISGSVSSVDSIDSYEDEISNLASGCLNPNAVSSFDFQNKRF